MFEYFMPQLLLPWERDSLLYESLAFCVCEQKERAARAGAPWGISESAFCALDASLTYQYKAHGVQALGLKRGLDRELVVAPYASFLALSLVPGAATANLRRLRDLGLEGKYGLCEAADFTPERLSGGERFAAVQTYMVHHLGMSLVAVDNALRDNVMQRRFLRDPAMGAYRELLREKVPVGARPMKHPRRDAPRRPRRPDSQGWSREARLDFLLSNGSYTRLLDREGGGWAELGGFRLTLEGPAFRLCRAGEELELSPGTGAARRLASGRAETAGMDTALGM